MAITAVHKNAVSATGDVTFPSWTPVANRLYIVCCIAINSSFQPTAPTVTGNGLTWTKIADFNSGSFRNMCVFWALGSSPTTGTTVVHWSGTNTSWASLDEFDGMDTTSPIGNVLTANGTSNSPLVTLSAFSNPLSIALGFFKMESSTITATVGSGFTSLVTNTVSSTRQVVEYGAANDNTVDLSLGGSISWIGAGVEIHAPNLSQTITIGSGIASAEAFGAPMLVAFPPVIGPTAITSAEVVPSIVLSARHTAFPTAVASSEAFGAFNIYGPPQSISFNGQGIPSAQVVSNIILAKGLVAIVALKNVPIPDVFLAALLGSSTQVTRRVEIYEEDGTTPWDLDADFLSGSVTVDMTRDERRSFDLTLDNSENKYDNYPGGFWYDKVIKMFRGINLPGIGSWETQLGEFRIVSIAEDNFPHSTSVSGLDYTSKLTSAKLPASTTFSAGQAPEDIIKTLATNGRISKFAMVPTGVTTDKDYVFEQGTTRWEAISTVATAYNQEVFFDAFGYLVLRPFQDPVTSPTVFTFQTGTPDGNLTKYSKKSNSGRIYNHVVVTGEAANQVPVWAEVFNTEPSSPTSVDNLDEVRTFTFSSSFLTTYAQCLSVAHAFLSIHALESFELDLGSIVLPWLEAGNIIRFADPSPNPGDPDRYLLSSFGIPLSLDEMSANGRRVTVVT